MKLLELQQQQFDQNFIGYSKKENLLNVESRIVAIDSSNVEIGIINSM
jgi:hypothetical protein